MGPNLMLPFYILEYLSDQTDEDTPKLPTVIVKEMQDRYGSDIIGKSETLIQNIDKINKFFRGRCDGIDVIQAVTGVGSEKHRSNKHYYLAMRIFDFDESVFMHKLLMDSKAISQDAIQEMCSKLSNLMSCKQRKNLKHAIVTDGSAKTKNKAVFFNLDKLLNAIEANQNIEFTYNEYNMEKMLVPKKRDYSYIVSPYEVTCSYGSYFMTGFHIPTKGIRTYRLDKITGLKENNQHEYYRDKDFNSVEYHKNAVFMHPDKDRVYVKLRCEKSILDDVIERFENCKLSSDETSEGHFIASIPNTTMIGMKYWILEFSSACEVLEPAELRRDIKVTLERALSWYKD